MKQESPRQVFLNGCREISSAVEPMGFRFAQSGPHATRRVGDWTFQIRFQSDYLNIAGEYVAVIVHASVCNKSLKAWDERSAWPENARDWVAGGQLGNLRTPCQWLTWNIANLLTRQAELEDITANIKTIVLPLFERFDTPRELAEQVACSEVPGFMFPEDAVRFVFWQLGSEEAQRCLSFWIQHFNDWEGFRHERDAAVPLRHMGGETGVQRLAKVARAMKIGLRL
jgi:hypothetical protein